MSVPFALGVLAYLFASSFATVTDRGDVRKVVWTIVSIVILICIIWLFIPLPVLGRAT